MRHASWIIRDSNRKVRTGSRADEPEKAQQRLATYITERYSPARKRARHPTEIKIADIISVYSDDIAGRLKRPREVAARLGRVLEHFRDKRLSVVTRAACRAYVAARGNEGAARRELEDFRAAINYCHAEGFLEVPVAVTLPAKGEARERWLTRSEVARLIWSAWHYREVQKGYPTGRKSRQHFARFILVALYTGTRAGAICGAAIRPAVGSGYVDLQRGVLYRRAPGSRETKKRQPPSRYMRASCPTWRDGSALALPRPK